MITDKLQEEFSFSDGSIDFLEEKGLEEENFKTIYDALQLPPETFQEHREKENRLEMIARRGDSQEITTGRYERYVEKFKDISSEQALVKGRLKFAVEYIITVSDTLSEQAPENKLVSRPFTIQEKEKLRGIYQNFTVADYIAIKEIEKKTNHDIVAANTWLAVKGQTLGLDDNLMRSITHFARTSADVNTNVIGELYSNALGEWCKTLGELVEVLKDKGEEYSNITCIAHTHGQEAQLTTLGHVYVNLAEQIKLQAENLLGENKLLIDGKIAGAIGTDVDMCAAFPEIDWQPTYKNLVENIFGLRYVELGNDQDSSNSRVFQSLDAMVNVGTILEKAATDVWLQASRKQISKKTKKGESGSSAMPQKTNPFFAEGCEALMEISSSVITPIKKLLGSYRDQGDLRRSITKREMFHPIMLSVIGIRRLISEISKYTPNQLALETTIYEDGVKVISSAVQTYLRSRGVSDAYDRLKDLTMTPNVQYSQIENYINGLTENGKLSKEEGDTVSGMFESVMDTRNLRKRLRRSDENMRDTVLRSIYKTNSNVKSRAKLLGNALKNTSMMIENANQTIKRLNRYTT
jgi:adenylosuccinate lyase